VYAALARLLLGADVVDVTQRDSFGRPLVVPASFPPPAPSQADRPPGGLLTPPNPRRDGAGTAGTASSNQKQPWGYATRQPAAPFDETLDDAIWEASRDFDRRARAFADALTQLAAISYRGELSKTLGHPLQWLRTLAKVEYEPQLLSLVARACENADQPLPPSLRLLNLSLPSRVNLARSRHTLARYLGETFDIMSDLAGEWLAAFGGWARLTEAPPPRFWSLPVSKAARAFIDAAFPALVFEDVDAAWPPQGLA
jgi:hypothetical protein